MIRVALISDIHANALALEAVLAEIGRAGVDETVCLGDVATLGPRPSEVIDILGERGIRSIMGNHDEFLLDPELIHAYRTVPVVVDAVGWCRSRLSGAELAFLGTFHRQIEIPLGAHARLLLFHGSPRSHMENLLAATPDAALDEALDGHHATVMAGGHTHLQMIRAHRGALVVNPGSVGMPFKEFVGARQPTVLSHADYAIVEASATGVRVDLRHVALERGALYGAMAATDNPLRASLLQQYAA